MVEEKHLMQNLNQMQEGKIDHGPDSTFSSTERGKHHISFLTITLYSSYFYLFVINRGKHTAGTLNTDKAIRWLLNPDVSLVSARKDRETDWFLWATKNKTELYSGYDTFFLFLNQHFFIYRLKYKIHIFISLREQSIWNGKAAV